MSDGSKRLITMAKGAPKGAFNEPDQVDCPITPQPAPEGTTEEQPDTMLFEFADWEENLSNYPFEPILAELRFTQYEYDPEEGNAIWSVALFAEGVQLSTSSWIINGDNGAVATVEL